jgi:hypothetical protein
MDAPLLSPHILDATCTGYVRLTAHAKLHRKPLSSIILPIVAVSFADPTSTWHPGYGPVGAHKRVRRDRA